MWLYVELKLLKEGGENGNWIFSYFIVGNIEKYILGV